MQIVPTTSRNDPYGFRVARIPLLYGELRRSREHICGLTISAPETSKFFIRITRHYLRTYQIFSE